MLERFNPVLRIVCLLLAGLVLYQISRLATRKDPLKNVNINTLTLTRAEEVSTESKTTNAIPTGNSAKEAELAPAAKARVDRITQSEILGPVVRPLPLALLGIAGKDAFLRAPNGQTGLLSEGEELGGVKLLRIGTNRVLVEYEKQQKELTVFSGFGSETLLLKGTNPP